MTPLPCTTVAGRHAADQARERRRADRSTDQDTARWALERALRTYGLTTHPHLQPSLGIDRTIWVNCRLPTASADHAWIYAQLDELGWRPDRERLSRIRQGYDVLRLRHTASDATLVLIVKVPFGAVEPLEAA